MQLENSFTVPAPPDVAWAILLDVPRIAPCMPGAELTETVGERTYKGNAKLRVGPVSLTFSGEAEITEIDEANRTATVKAKGNDTKGRGAATASVVFKLVADGDASRVDIASDIDLTGSIAQYGRASGLIDAIAGQIISDFAKNLEAEIGAAGDVAAGTPEADAATAEVAPAQPATVGPADNSISGISLFFRALWSMIRGAFGGKA
ncbi:MAG: SRPBCC family protein [Proteobacteria bacterium]|nr:SRPBCC family protein [Pseudomonadota bacterium]